MPPTSTPPTPVSLTWKDELRVGTTARLEATIVAQGGGPSGTIALRSAGRELASAIYTGGKREVALLSFEPEAAGFVDAELLLITDNGRANSLPLPVVLPICAPQQVLYLGDLQQNGAAELAHVLGSGFEIKQVSPAESADFGSAVAACDLVVLDDRPASSIPPAAEQRLVDAVVNEGLGLVMCGGRGAFGSGGWHNRPLESILPVEFIQKEEKRDPSTTLVIVIDTSGSMSGVRVQLAKEVSRLAMRRLLPHDKVGIVEFYGAKRWAAPIQPASNAIELQRALNRMDAGGGTVIMPALVEAFYALQNVDTRYKHVLVLTDGGVESGDFQSLMRRMSNEGINVSTVLSGGGYHSEFLVNIANWGKGRFYNVPNRFNLPEILLKQPSTAKLPAYRPGVHQVRARGGPGWWGAVDLTRIPDLAGYVETKARVGSEVLLETVDHRHPVLASWRFGLGRGTSWCTEPVGSGTRPCRPWPRLGRQDLATFGRRVGCAALVSPR
ncbi:MAG: VWA domain-containing protein, partial [Planctomycetaceae bacterium]